MNHRRLNACNQLEKQSWYTLYQQSCVQLKKIQPLFSHWLNDTIPDKMPVEQTAFHISHIDQGTLYIGCKNAGLASLLRHKQKSLLQYLHHHQQQEVHTIQLFMHNASQQNQSHTSAPTRNTTQKVDSMSITAMRKIAQSIDNDALSVALTDLADALGQSD